MLRARNKPALVVNAGLRGYGRLFGSDDKGHLVEVAPPCYKGVPRLYKRNCRSPRP